MAPGEAGVQEATGRLALQAQPAYSPELNPPERIWKELRRVVTHNHGCVTVKEHIEAIRNCFRYLAGGTVRLRQLCGCDTPDSWVASLELADLCEDEGIPFALGDAFYIRAIHGGNAKHDRTDAHKIVALLSLDTLQLKPHGARPDLFPRRPGQLVFEPGMPRSD